MFSISIRERFFHSKNKISFLQYLKKKPDNYQDLVDNWLDIGHSLTLIENQYFRCSDNNRPDNIRWQDIGYNLGNDSFQPYHMQNTNFFHEHWLNKHTNYVDRWRCNTSTLLLARLTTYTSNTFLDEYNSFLYPVFCSDG